MPPASRAGSVPSFGKDQAAAEAARRAALLRRADAPSLSSYQRALRLQKEARAMMLDGRASAAQAAARTALDIHNGIGPAPTRSGKANTTAQTAAPEPVPSLTARL